MLYATSCNALHLILAHMGCGAKESSMHNVYGVSALTLCLVCWATSAVALPAFGQAATSCEAYVAEYKEAIRHGDFYSQRMNTDMRLAWIAGFLSAIMTYLPQDRERLSQIDMTDIRQWIVDYCQHHPRETLLQATQALYESLKKPP